MTYNPRNDLQLEAEVLDFLHQTGKALSVSGPTKSGKTVLVQRVLPESHAIWLQGSDIDSADSFWRAIVDWFGLYDTIEYADDAQDQTTFSGKVSGGLPFVGQGEAGMETGTSSTTGRRWSRTRAFSELARESLRNTPVPLVIDDFHYIKEEARQDIARAIKTLIRIVPVVMIAVPHEAFEAVTQEPEMGGRVWHLRITLWSHDELAYIARSGFEALNVADPDETITRKLAQSSFGAPFLMQQLCYDVATKQGIAQHQVSRVELKEPPQGWGKFFSRIADRSVPPVFDRLRKGPKVRGQDRIARVFKDGARTDIYGAVLRALSIAGPKPATAQQEIVRILQANLVEPARGQHVSSALAQMSEIANDAKGSSDPALVFKNDEVYILDPFLLFFLRHGEWSMESYTGVA